MDVVPEFAPRLMDGEQDLVDKMQATVDNVQKAAEQRRTWGPSSVAVVEHRLHAAVQVSQISYLTDSNVAFNQSCISLHLLKQQPLSLFICTANLSQSSCTKAASSSVCTLLTPAPEDKAGVRAEAAALRSRRGSAAKGTAGYECSRSTRPSWLHWHACCTLWLLCQRSVHQHRGSGHFHRGLQDTVRLIYPLFATHVI